MTTPKLPNLTLLAALVDATPGSALACIAGVRSGDLTRYLESTRVPGETTSTVILARSHRAARRALLARIARREARREARLPQPVRVRTPNRSGSGVLRCSCGLDLTLAMVEVGACESCGLEV